MQLEADGDDNNDSDDGGNSKMDVDAGTEDSAEPGCRRPQPRERRIGGCSPSRKRNRRAGDCCADGWSRVVSYFHAHRRGDRSLFLRIEPLNLRTATTARAFKNTDPLCAVATHRTRPKHAATLITRMPLVMTMQQKPGALPSSIEFPADHPERPGEKVYIASLMKELMELGGRQLLKTIERTGARGGRVGSAPQHNLPLSRWRR